MPAQRIGIGVEEYFRNWNAIFTGYVVARLFQPHACPARPLQDERRGRRESRQEFKAQAFAGSPERLESAVGGSNACNPGNWWCRKDAVS
jgi:hypothetical protein